MSAGRGRLEIGSYGDIQVQVTQAGNFRAEARHRDWDGIVRKVTANAATRSAAKAALRQRLSSRSVAAGFGGRLTTESTLGALSEAWLADV